MATITVEDGTIVTNANSYITTAELDTYVGNRGYTLTQEYGTDSEILVKAMDYVDNLNFVGVRSSRDQPVNWPRYNVNIDGLEVLSDSIPQELKDLQAAVAMAIDKGNDPHNIIERGIKRERVDVIETEYMDNAASSIIDPKIVDLMKKLVAPGNNGINFSVFN